jgi:DNA phosphorothioation-associated putative methyltransferase
VTGKLLPTALYIHRSALETLPPLLRVYEGCASAYLGEIEGANLIKLHRHSGKVSYLAYPDFESNPHPALLRSSSLIPLRNQPPPRRSSTARNPCSHPIPPLHAKFAKLTQQEEKHGLLDDTTTIGTRDGWLARLNAAGFALRGHRLVRQQ